MIEAVWTGAHRRHDPTTRALMGRLEPAQEVAARGDALRAALTADPFVRLHEPIGGCLDDVLAVHDPDLVAFLGRVVRDWRGSGRELPPGRPAIVPFCFANPNLRPGRTLKPSQNVVAELGTYAADTLTVVFDGTYEAAVAAAHAAVTAARLAADGASLTYAAVRPPGHHAGPRTYGGACFLNNAAIAAHWLTAHGFSRVAIVDVDAHHGNGTQEIFYARGDVFYGSVHADPAQEYPWWLGYADETGQGDGAGATFNAPLPPRTPDSHWLAALRRVIAAVADFRPDMLVVSLGVDGLAADPNSFLDLTPAAYVEAGRLLGAMGLPMVCVQEGGYVCDVLGSTVLGFLHGVQRDVGTWSLTGRGPA